MADTVVSKVKETAIEDAQRAQILLRDAAKSGAYLYPLKGIFYFLSNRTLWRPFLSRLLPALTTAASVTAAMFLFTYLPQVALLTLVNGPLAVVTTIALVLSESATITYVISRAMFIDEALVDTFDATLITKSLTPLVAKGRVVKGSGAADAVGRLGKLVKNPLERFTPSAIIRYFMYLPLNMIPVVGTVLFIILQGKRLGPNAHTRYFQLKGMGSREKKEWVQKRTGAYTSFGVPATVLEMIPFVGIFFAFTNTVGAALWAVDIENGQMDTSETTTDTDSTATVSQKKEL